MLDLRGQDVLPYAAILIIEYSCFITVRSVDRMSRLQGAIFACMELR